MRVMKPMKSVVVGALVLAVSLLPARLTAQDASARPPVILHAGDVVRVTVWRQPDLSGEFMIREDGTLSHPLYRTLHLAGLDFDQAESRMATLLEEYETQPRFVMQPLLRVSIGGEVRAPDLYRLPPATTIAEAIAMAGGVTERGRMEEIRLIRDGREVEIDLRAEGYADEPIQSGDQLFVKRRVNLFREYIAPAGGLIAATASIINIILN